MFLLPRSFAHAAAWQEPWYGVKDIYSSFHLLKKSDINKLGFLPDPIMPGDYGKTLSATEIDDLVSYLMSAARATTNAKRNPDDEGE